MDGFAHVHPIEVRFRDLDALGHVNNATIITFIETARVPYIVGLGLWLPEQPVAEIPVVVAHIDCNFRSPILLGQQVEVGTRAVKVGRSSLWLEHRVEVDGKLAADGHCVLVFMDIPTGQSAAITPQMLAQIEAFEGRKVATKG